jgi:hypothetical protein
MKRLRDVQTSKAAETDAQLVVVRVIQMGDGPGNGHLNSSTSFM